MMRLMLESLVTPLVVGLALLLVCEHGSASERVSFTWMPSHGDTIAAHVDGNMVDAIVEVRPVVIKGTVGKERNALLALVHLPEERRGLWIFRNTLSKDSMAGWPNIKQELYVVVAGDKTLAIRYFSLGARLVVESYQGDVDSREELRLAAERELTDHAQSVYARDFWNGVELSVSEFIEPEFFVIRGRHENGLGTRMKAIQTFGNQVRVVLENAHGATATIELTLDLSVKRTEYKKAASLGMRCDSVVDCFEKTPFVITDTGVEVQDKQRQLSLDESTQFRMLNQVYQQIKNQGVDLLKEKVYCVETAPDAVSVYIGAPPALNFIDDISLKILVNPVKWDDVFITYRGRRRPESTYIVE